PQASKGVLQGYNAQAAATTGHIVVAAEITNAGVDPGPNLSDKAKHTLAPQGQHGSDHPSSGSSNLFGDP
ncbi:hypothetical protein ACWDUN_29465, partial [Mycobacterium sp. NPDC003323]